MIWINDKPRTGLSMIFLKREQQNVRAYGNF